MSTLADNRAESLRLAVLILAHRFNLAAANPASCQAHLEAALVELIPLARRDPTIRHAISVLDAFGGHPDNPSDFDSADPELVQVSLCRVLDDVARLPD